MAKNSQAVATKTLNAIRSEASAGYKAVVPFVDGDTSLTTLKTIFSVDSMQYVPQQNEFVKVLVNRIAFTAFMQMSYENKLKRLKKGYRAPLGTDIQHIYTNPINPRAYDGNNLSGILTKYDSDTKVAYYRRNRQDVFPVTINREQVAGAFVSWESFNTFVSNIISAVFSGNEIREYNLFKQSLVDAVEAGYLVEKYIDYPTADNAKDIVADLRTLAANMTFPSSKYNKYKEIAEANGVADVTPVRTNTPTDRQVIIMRNDILQKFDVEVLAGAFNMTEVEFRANLIPVDDFGYDIYDLSTGKITGRKESNIAYVVCDEALFQVYDNLSRSGGDFNEFSLSWQFFYHVWQTYGICPFANCVVYETTTAPTLLGIGVDKTIVTLDAETTSDTIAYNFTPEAYKGEVEMTLISATKDGEAFDGEVNKLTIDQDAKTIEVEEADELAAGSYEAKYVLRTTASSMPNVIISVGVTKA